MTCFAKPLILILLTLSLSACGILPDGKSSHGASSPRPASTAARINPSQSAQACLANLGKAQVSFTALPDRYLDGGCSQINTVQMTSAGMYGREYGNRTLAVSNLGPVRCELANTFAAWAQFAVAPAARQMLGSELVRIETMGSYSCRNIAGSAKLSEHSHANAIDVAAFILADGRRVSVKADWSGDADARKFLRTVHDSACKRFTTVLSPEYNAAHQDHFHLDLSGKGFCH